MAQAFPLVFCLGIEPAQHTVWITCAIGDQKYFRTPLDPAPRQG